MLIFFSLLALIAGAFTAFLFDRAFRHRALIDAGDRKPRYPGHRIHAEPGWMVFRAKSFGLSAIAILCILFNFLAEPARLTAGLTGICSAAMAGFLLAGLCFRTRRQRSP